jgi:hypothetical protein
MISYPDTGVTGLNVLSMDRTEYISGDSYLNSMTAIAPGLNTLSVKLIFIDTCDQVQPACDSCLSPCLPCGQSENCAWYIDPINSGWEVSNLSLSNLSFND